MAGLSIIPISFGTCDFDKSSLTYMKNGGQRIKIPFISYVIVGGEKTIMVDTGPPPPEWNRVYQRPTEQSPEEVPVAALASRGFSPSDIDVVVLSHLHWDHCANNTIFENAEVFVQRSELQYAAAPLPVHVRPYQSPKTGLDPLWRGTKFTVVDGDREVAPGVSLIHTPGHSPGSQCVVVDGEKDRFVIAQDTIPLYENWEAAGPLVERTPNTIHVDLVSYYDSFRRIEEVGGRILPGHDPLVMEQESYT